jgi:hypothetical protein
VSIIMTTIKRMSAIVSYAVDVVKEEIRAAKFLGHGRRSRS